MSIKKQGGIRFNGSEYYEINVQDENISLLADVDGTSTEYDVTGGGGGGIERKSLYVNPDTSAQMTGDTLFQESEIEGYQYLIFTVTNTAESFEVEEWCEIAPLKEHGGQFVISFPAGGSLWVRKIYRSGGAVKPSVSVFSIGTTNENRDMCIVKSIEAAKGV